MHLLRITLRSGRVLGPAVHDNQRWIGWFGAGGITLSRSWVGVARPLAEALVRNPKLLAHEAVHVVQAERLGWRWLLAYAWAGIRALFRYRNISYEHEAFTRESAVLSGTDAEIADVQLVAL